MKRWMMGFLAGLLTAAVPALAQADCTDTLVISTYSRLTGSSANWRLAQLVTEETWNSRRSSGGLNGTLFDIPIGASYADYRSNVRNRLNSTSSAWSRSEMENVLWTGLDPNAPSAYTACLNASVFSQPGLQAAVVAASDTNILIRVNWNVPGVSTPATVSWTTPNIGGVQLPTRFPQGSTTISVPRPDRGLTLVANSAGYSTQPIVLVPLPPQQAGAASRTIAQRLYDGEYGYLVRNPSYPRRATGDPGMTFYQHYNEVIRIRYDRQLRLWNLSIGGGDWDSMRSTLCEPAAREVPAGTPSFLMPPGPDCREGMMVSVRAASPLRGEVVMVGGDVLTLDAAGYVRDAEREPFGQILMPTFPVSP